MWLHILHTCSCIFFVRLNTTINTSAQINFVWLHTIFLVTDLFFLIEVFTLAIIVLSVTIFSLFINRIQKHEYEFRFFLLPWVTEILLFYWHWKPCYYHNTDFCQYISIYRKYFFRISVIFRIPVTLTLTFCFGLDLNLFSLRLSHDTTLRLLLWF